MPARQPSRLGEFRLGYARLGVYSTKWEDLFRSFARAVTWRVANINVDRDTTTGHRVPEYSITHAIKGVFEERGGQLLPLPSGYVQRGDAVFRCFDNVRSIDQIWMPESERYYAVGYTYPLYEYLHQEDTTSFRYRICDLHYLALFKEVG